MGRIPLREEHMRNLLVIVMLVIGITHSPIAQDYTLSIPNEKVPRIKSAFAEMMPIPCDKSTGAPLYTEGQWVKECIKQFVATTVHRYEQKIAAEQAIDAVYYDEALLSITNGE